VSERVLFVDDEPNVLEGIQRSLRKRIDVHTANSGSEGLTVLQAGLPFAVVVSDMRMPGMNGVEFLTRVRETSPDTVRMILSGQADFEATLAAVNEGHIYRFLTKPCASDLLLAAVQDGLKQHRLLSAEKVLLEQTLGGAVKMLIEILGLVSPAASSRAARLQRYVKELASALGLADRWQWGLAAYLSQIGCVALPKDVLSKVEAGQALSEEERSLYESHPHTAGKLLAAIPRLEEVAAIVAAQTEAMTSSDLSSNLHNGDTASLGKLLLRTALDFDRLITQGVTREAAARMLRNSTLGLPEDVLKATLTLTVAKRDLVVRQLHLKDLAPGMILDEDLKSTKGIRLVPSGQEITHALIVRLLGIAEGVGVCEPFRVRICA
jgi:response regulator RpfG family c-di-GMP phosphodiesterase